MNKQIKGILRRPIPDEGLIRAGDRWEDGKRVPSIMYGQKWDAHYDQVYRPLKYTKVMRDAWGIQRRDGKLMLVVESSKVAASRLAHYGNKVVRITISLKEVK